MKKVFTFVYVFPIPNITQEELATKYSIYNYSNILEPPNTFQDKDFFL